MSEVKKKKSIIDIKNMKNKDKIVVLTSYSAHFARIIDDYTDVILVGDSLGMVLYGMDSTLNVSLSMMVAHGKAVKSHADSSCVVVDMPFGSYQESKEKAFKSASKIMKKTGCDAVKLEGGVEMAETIVFLVDRGIPVMAHIGLKPQSVNMHGGYRYQGRSEGEKQAIMADAKALEQAGAFAIVIECTDSDLAKNITESIAIPTIGIGAGSDCDGQVLVMEDMAGLFEKTPKFVKKYGDMRGMISNAAEGFAKEVKSGEFPVS